MSIFLVSLWIFDVFADLWCLCGSLMSLRIFDVVADLWCLCGDIKDYGNRETSFVFLAKADVWPLLMHVPKVSPTLMHVIPRLSVRSEYLSTNLQNNPHFAKTIYKALKLNLKNTPRGHRHQNAGPGVGRLVPYWAGLKFFLTSTKDILNGQKMANVMCRGVSIAFT